MRCLEEGTVLALLDGALPDLERAAIDAHLDGCALCLALVAHAARFAIGSAPTEAGDAIPSGALEAHQVSDRYELGAEIARGGMGRIFSARDRVLGRAVAIKCARESHPALEARFSREVRLTARLQHPAIVPIHDAGRLPDGRAFYAMRRIGGRPLDRRIADAPSLGDRLALLPNLIAVVDAVAYVHSQGVIHRDLKPHNVLVGEFGETVLVDWGLAKDLRERDPEPVGDGGRDDEGTTSDGDVIGTRGYMAPEQAQGSQVDERADVYGLGATLYHLIAGRPPGRGSSELPAAVAPDLAAIVARAMASEPEARYPSARQLAEDLHRFQTGRLVAAHRYSTADLLRRWIARHRRSLALAVVALAATAVVAIVSVRRVVVARRVAVAARAQAEEQRDAAQALVAFMMETLRDRLEAVGRLDALASTAEEVASYYDRLDRWGARGTDLRHRAAALGLLAQTRRQAGASEEALELNRRSVELARQAVARGDDPAAESELCRSLLQLADTAGALGKRDVTREALGECDPIARNRLAADQSNTHWQDVGATLAIELGLDARVGGDDAEAKRRFAHAQVLGRSLEAAGDPRGDRALARASALLAQLLMERGEWEAVGAVAEETLASARRMAERDPRDADAQSALAVGWERMGDVREQRGDLAGAEAAFREGHKVTSALVALEPGDARWARGLGTLEERLGALAQARGELAQALEHLTASRDISARLLEQDPNNAELMTELATSELNVADQLVEMRRFDDGRDVLARSRDLYERVERQAPSAEASQSVAMVWLHIGNLEVTARKRDAARSALERSAALSEQVLVRDDNPYNRSLVTEAYRLLAGVAPERAATLRARIAEIERRPLPDAPPTEARDRMVP